MKHFNVWSLMFCLINIHALKLTDHIKETLSTHFSAAGFACFDQYAITFEDIELLQAFKVPESQEAMCFFACVMRKDKMLDSEGKVSFPAVEKVAEDLFKDKSERGIAIRVFEGCESVNNQAVSDGMKGCDRARLILTCIKEKVNQENDEGNSSDHTNQNAPQHFSRYVDYVRTQVGDVARKLFIRFFLQRFCSLLNTLNIHKEGFISSILPRVTLLSAICTATTASQNSEK